MPSESKQIVVQNPMNHVAFGLTRNEMLKHVGDDLVRNYVTAFGPVSCVRALQGVREELAQRKLAAAIEYERVVDQQTTGLVFGIRMVSDCRGSEVHKVIDRGRSAHLLCPRVVANTCLQFEIA